MNLDNAAIRRAASTSSDPDCAAAELAEALGDAASGGVLFFCASTYDLPALGRALARRFPGTLVGCTGSGQIGPFGYQAEGVVALGMSAEVGSMRAYSIRPLADCESAAVRIAEQVSVELAASVGRRAFGLILADGLSLAEERLAASLYQSLGDVPVVGGSAGDDLQFTHTYVFVDGEFVEDAAVFVLVSTSAPFSTIKLQHFVPTGTRLVITAADPPRRVVKEINGRPAAQAYADLVGVPVDRLDASVFSTHPVMMRIGDQYYVRSIQRMNDDGSLTLFCAIEVGLVLTIGRGVDVIETLEQGFAAVGDDIAAVIGCDCILRRLEFEQRELADHVGAFLAEHRVVGFSTYGEQYNGIHVNQTFVGVAIGGAHG